MYLLFLWISEQTAIISLYIINLKDFITEAESVYCAVRTGSLNATDPVLKWVNISRNVRRSEVFLSFCLKGARELGVDTLSFCYCVR